MKKLPLALVAILTLTALLTYIDAQGIKPTRGSFSEFLQGTVAPGTPRNYGEWTAINDEVIEGSLDGNLVGSPTTFRIVSDRRFNAEEQLSFIDGSWTFMTSDGDSIGGIFFGNGTSLTVFLGKFVSTSSEKRIGTTYSKVKISGNFSCWFLQPVPYGGRWRYEAWWNGTFRQEAV